MRGDRLPLLLVWLCLAAQAAAADCQTSSIEQRFADDIERIAAHPQVAGISVAMGIGDPYRWAQAAGSANLELKVPMTPATKVRIGSVSKLHTTAGMMQLVQRGALDLDTAVQRYVPGFPGKAQPITLRQLAGHLSGIRHYVHNDRLLGPEPSWQEAHLRAYPQVRDALPLFQSDDLLSAPGERFAYSSYGFTLISAAIESAAKAPFLLWLASDVLMPLGLRETEPDRIYEIIEHRASFYEADGDRLKLAPMADRSYVWAGGGLLSTARDLVQFGARHRPGDFYTPASLALMFKPQRTHRGEPTAYGIGWQVDFAEHATGMLAEIPVEPALRDEFLRLVRDLPFTVGHSGSAPGAVAQLLLHPPTQTVVAYVANTNTDTDPWFVALQVAAFRAYRALVAESQSCTVR